MKNKKGFTLIELLAVIVILAAIALIATPIIMSVINDAKRGAAKNSAYGIIKAGELKMNTSNFKAPATYTEESRELNYKGTKPEKLKLDIDKQGNIKLAVFVDEFCVVKDYHESEVRIDDTLKTADTCVNGTMDIEELHKLEIKYKYSDGSTAAPSVIAYYLQGETYSYMSPTIDGYTPDYAFVKSAASGMPEYDIEVTVTYTPNVILQG